MTGFFETKELWASVIGALIGAVATIGAVWIAVALGLRKLRDTEMSRLRIRCVTELIAYRFTIGPTAAAGIEGKTAFFAALNAIPALFGQDADIMRLLRDFREEGADRKNPALLKLIRATAVATSIPLAAVSDVDLERPFMEEAGARAPLQTGQR